MQTVTPDGLELVPAIIEAAQGGKWSLLVSLSIMALVWLATKAPLLSDLIKGEAKVWTAAVAGMLAAVASTALTTGADSLAGWLAAIGSGLGVGLSATGLYELIRRRIEGKPIDADNDGQLDP